MISVVRWSNQTTTWNAYLRNMILVVMLVVLKSIIMVYGEQSVMTSFIQLMLMWCVANLAIPVLLDTEMLEC